jgi:hypothetical protein
MCSDSDLQNMFEDSFSSVCKKHGCGSASLQCGYGYSFSDADPAFHLNADPGPAPLFKVMGIGDHQDSIFSLQASIVNIHGPPQLYVDL